MFNMFGKQSRIDREKKTIQTMIRMHCHDMHDTEDAFCNDCQDLLEYAGKRLDKCTYQQQKPTCDKCPVHCYAPDMREKIRSVMRYSGPRMVYLHPVQAIRHLVDGRKKLPPNPKQMV